MSYTKEEIKQITTFKIVANSCFYNLKYDEEKQLFKIASVNTPDLYGQWLSQKVIEKFKTGAWVVSSMFPIY